jgi:SAM-dependent methyltransferase
MAHPDSEPANRELKAGIRSMWALGNYHEFATELVWTIGPELVAACAIGPGQRVLDVAAGTGNVAIRAAQTGARVVASDLTPENFEAGRREPWAPRSSGWRQTLRHSLRHEPERAAAFDRDFLDFAQREKPWPSRGAGRVLLRVPAGCGAQTGAWQVRVSRTR